MTYLSSRRLPPGKLGMHDHFAERDQFQRLDKLLAGNVLAKKPASSCSQRGPYVIRPLIGGKDD